MSVKLTYPEHLKDVPAGVLCWHIHHSILMEVSTEPLASRIDYIIKQKCAYEPPRYIQLRLRLLAVVKGKLPEKVVQSAKAYYKAVKALREIKDAVLQSCLSFSMAYETLISERTAAEKAFDIASKTYWDTLEEFASEIEALHKQECPNCPWYGRTIFN